MERFRIDTEAFLGLAMPGFGGVMIPVYSITVLYDIELLFVSGLFG